MQILSSDSFPSQINHVSSNSLHALSHDNIRNIMTHLPLKDAITIAKIVAGASSTDVKITTARDLLLDALRNFNAKGKHDGIFIDYINDLINEILSHEAINHGTGSSRRRGIDGRSLLDNLLLKAEDDLDVVDALMQNPIIDKNMLFRSAVVKNRPKLVARILENKSVDPAANYHDAFFYAVEKGYVEVVKLFLKDPRIDPSVDDNEALLTAFMYSHFEIVELLLKDPRVDPNVDHGALLNLSMMKNQPYTVELLLKHPKWNLEILDILAFTWAISEGHIRIIEFLLQSGKVDPTAYNFGLIALASVNGHFDAVELLLKAAPTANHNFAIRWAASYNRKEMVEELLNDPHVDPSDAGNSAIKAACLKNNLEIVKLLLRDIRVNPSAGLRFAKTFKLKSLLFIETIRRKSQKWKTIKNLFG